MNGEYEDTKSWNPFLGCRFNCIYCFPSFHSVVAWSGRMKRCILCQTYTPHEHPERLNRIPSKKAIFVCEDGDITFARYEFMLRILEVMREDRREGRLWYLQSKNPECFNKYLSFLPENTWLLTTLETNIDEDYHEISQAPLPSRRYNDFINLEWSKKLLTIEPVMDFDLEIFTKWILDLKPRVVFIGYNSHPESVKLPEPDRKKLWKLIHILEDKNIHVLKKEMRDRRVMKKAYKDAYHLLIQDS